MKAVFFRKSKGCLAFISGKCQHMGVRMRKGCKAGGHCRSKKVQKRRNHKEKAMAQGGGSVQPAGGSGMGC